MELKIQKDIAGEVSAPILLAGWPGMGSVAISAVNYMRRKLDAVLFAEFDLTEHVTPKTVVIEESLLRLPDEPNGVFYHVENSDLLIFEDSTQVEGTAAMELTSQILDVAKRLNVQAIYTGSAFVNPTSHKEPSRVFGVANRAELRDRLFSEGAEPFQKGHISGLNGLLPGYAGLRQIPAACILATMPQYGIHVPNPKASREIVRFLCRLLGLELDMDELDESVDAAETILEKLAG